MNTNSPKTLAKAPLIGVIATIISSLMTLLVQSNKPTTNLPKAEKFFSDWLINKSVNNSQLNEQVGKNNNSGSGSGNITGDRNVFGDGNVFGSGNSCNNHSCNKHEDNDYSQNSQTHSTHNQNTLLDQRQNQNTLINSTHNLSTQLNQSNQFSPTDNRTTLFNRTQKHRYQVNPINNWNNTVLQNRFSTLQNLVSFDKTIEILLTQLKATTLFNPNFEYGLLQSSYNSLVLETSVNNQNFLVDFWKIDTETLIRLESQSNAWKGLVESTENPKALNTVEDTALLALLLQGEGSMILPFSTTREEKEGGLGQPNPNPSNITKALLTPTKYQNFPGALSHSKESKSVPEPRNLVGVSLVGLITCTWVKNQYCSDKL